MAPDTCPNCGADVPPRAKACPECGADEATGWSEEAAVGDLDLPGGSFDYEEFIEREFGDTKTKPRGIKAIWWVVAIALILLLLRIFFHF